MFIVKSDLHNLSCVEKKILVDMKINLFDVKNNLLDENCNMKNNLLDEKHVLIDDCVAKHNLIDENLETLDMVDKYGEVFNDDLKIEYENILFSDDDHDLASSLDNLTSNENFELNKNCEKVVNDSKFVDENFLLNGNSIILDGNLDNESACNVNSNTISLVEKHVSLIDFVLGQDYFLNEKLFALQELGIEH